MSTCHSQSVALPACLACAAAVIVTLKSLLAYYIGRRSSRLFPVVDAPQIATACSGNVALGLRCSPGAATQMAEVFNALRTGTSFNKKRFGCDIEFFQGALHVCVQAAGSIDFLCHTVEQPQLV